MDNVVHQGRRHGLLYKKGAHGKLFYWSGPLSGWKKSEYTVSEFMALPDAVWYDKPSRLTT